MVISDRNDSGVLQQTRLTGTGRDVDARCQTRRQTVSSVFHAHDGVLRHAEHYGKLLLRLVDDPAQFGCRPIRLLAHKPYYVSYNTKYKPPLEFVLALS